jgi:hypothetical protein
LDLAKMIDKLDPMEFESQIGSKYKHNPDETIEEEHSHPSEDSDKPRSRLLSSHSSGSRGHRSNEYVNPLSLQFFRQKNYRTSRSLIAPFDQDSIAEELEEYEYPMCSRIDESMHCFKIPMRNKP